MIEFPSQPRPGRDSADEAPDAAPDGVRDFAGRGPFPWLAPWATAHHRYAAQTAALWG